ncbi:hypothetical protein EV702DRAFT_1201627 [Suillus placidus]|uniref:Uncharacterized protein n=1 Tax=Suillus placidus TaxID=48579 RepID=A0A9P6ZMC1_9AGAM|nr:hypothetical protein EV702DRAFT_1201627 [Suillus placidus]
MDFNDSNDDDIELPFELSASFMLFEVTLLPGNDDSLSISQLLDIVGLSDLDLGVSFPAISNLSNALSITHISMGWTISLLPDFFKRAISLDDWEMLFISQRVPRTLSTCINAMLHVGHVPSTVSIVVTFEDETEIALVFAPSGPPLTMRDVVGQFIPDSATITLPDTVTFLADIGLQQASVAMHLGNGKFSLSQLLYPFSSRIPKEWKEKMAEFHSMLSLANNTDYLDYLQVHVGPIGDQPSLTAKATYSSTTSTLDILRHVSGIDLGNCFENLSLSALISVVDINMSNLTATLMHDPATNAFSFDADTDWLCFSHLRFACSKSQTWSYSLGFSLRPDVNVLQYIPILGPIVNSRITLINVALVVFNHKLDVAALPITLSIPVKSMISQSLFNVAFAGRLALAKSSLKTLAKTLGVDTNDILGIVGNEYLHLSISVKTIYLWNGEASLAVLICSDETELLPKVGIQGTAVLNFGEQVSKNPIATSLFLFVDFSMTVLGFKFTLDQWKGVFGYDGLNFENIVFEAEFPPEEFPLPSEFTVSGTVDLREKVQILWQLDILKSYAMGRIEGLTLNNIIETFSDAHDVPDYLDLRFGPYEFKIVPIDLVDSKGNIMKQQFAMRGSFKIPSLHFSADGKVNICTSHVIIDGHLSPVVVNKKLFSILASSNENPPPPSGSGASIHVSVNDDLSPFELEASSDGLAFSIDREWATDGSLSGIVKKEKLAISASLSISESYTHARTSNWLGLVQ